MAANLFSPYLVLLTNISRFLGISTLILTNACGALNKEYNVGDLVPLHDHISLAGMGGLNPLIGPNEDNLGVRFPAMSNAYSITLRRKLFKAAQRIGTLKKRSIHEGVYAYVSGPSFETRAEARLLRHIGADVVGMSTVYVFFIFYFFNIYIYIYIYSQQTPFLFHTPSITYSMPNSNIQTRSNCCKTFGVRGTSYFACYQ